MAVKGIDVSHWQGTIDWAKVKAAGIGFAIIKAGGSDDGFYTDSQFERNYKGAKANGIPVGAYYFVGKDCVTAAAGKADAERFIRILKGKQFEYPVYMDNEAQPASAKNGITDATIAFCEAMEDAGYFAGVYGSTYSGFHDRMDDSRLKAYTHWVAQYASKCTYAGSYGIWQYSSSGFVSGISGRVDMDWAYQDFPSVIKGGGFNGYKKSGGSSDTTPAKTGTRTADAFVSVMEGWNGYSKANGKFKTIIDTYNSHKPLARGYAVKYTDEWCDTCVSAAAVKAGMTDLIGTECGCEEHVKIFKSKGIWIEDGTITPKRGDIILYNWNDSTQPNDGGSDHIGVVTGVSDGKITVIEGNKGEAVGYRTIPVGWGYIRGFARPKYEGVGSSPATPPPAPKKSVEELAKEVLAGKWGNGDDRKSRLTAAGYDYGAVQARVNELCRQKSKSVDELAREVIRGKWGNGQDRKNRLTAAGYDYNAVQKRVNEILR